MVNKKLKIIISMILPLILILSTNVLSVCSSNPSMTDYSAYFQNYDFNNDPDGYGDITGWNTSCITNMNNMFENSNFNQDISGWDVSNVQSMEFMFAWTNFNQNINAWNTSSLIQAFGVFMDNNAFNQPMNNWDVSNVVDFYGMFRGTSFNYSINEWDVRSGTNFGEMFMNTPFNHPLNDWETDNMQNLWSMFASSGFNQNVSMWNYTNVFEFNGFFNDNNLSYYYYDDLLNTLASQGVSSDMTLDMGHSMYSSNGQSSRDYLINTLNWDIIDGGFLAGSIPICDNVTAINYGEQYHKCVYELQGVNSTYYINELNYIDNPFPFNIKINENDSFLKVYEFKLNDYFNVNYTSLNLEYFLEFTNLNGQSYYDEDFNYIGELGSNEFLSPFIPYLITDDFSLLLTQEENNPRLLLGLRNNDFDLDINLHIVKNIEENYQNFLYSADDFVGNTSVYNFELKVPKSFSSQIINMETDLYLSSKSTSNTITFNTDTYSSSNPISITVYDKNSNELKTGTNVHNNDLQIYLDTTNNDIIIGGHDLNQQSNIKFSVNYENEEKQIFNLYVSNINPQLVSGTNIIFKKGQNLTLNINNLYDDATYQSSYLQSNGALIPNSYTTFGATSINNVLSLQSTDNELKMLSESGIQTKNYTLQLEVTNNFGHSRVDSFNIIVKDNITHSQVFPDVVLETYAPVNIEHNSVRLRGAMVENNHLCINLGFLMREAGTQFWDMVYWSIECANFPTSYIHDVNWLKPNTNYEVIATSRYFKDGTFKFQNAPYGYSFTTSSEPLPNPIITGSIPNYEMEHFQSYQLNMNNYFDNHDFMYVGFFNTNTNQWEYLINDGSNTQTDEFKVTFFSNGNLRIESYDLEISRKIYVYAYNNNGDFVSQYFYLNVENPVLNVEKIKDISNINLIDYQSFMIDLDEYFKFYDSYELKLLDDDITLIRGSNYVDNQSNPKINIKLGFDNKIIFESYDKDYNQNMRVRAFNQNSFTNSDFSLNIDGSYVPPSDLIEITPFIEEVNMGYMEEVSINMNDYFEGYTCHSLRVKNITKNVPVNIMCDDLFIFTSSPFIVNFLKVENNQGNITISSYNTDIKGEIIVYLYNDLGQSIEKSISVNVLPNQHLSIISIPTLMESIFSLDKFEDYYFPINNYFDAYDSYFLIDNKDLDNKIYSGSSYLYMDINREYLGKTFTFKKPFVIINKMVNNVLFSNHFLNNPPMNNLITMDLYFSQDISNIETVAYFGFDNFEYNGTNVFPLIPEEVKGINKYETPQSYNIDDDNKTINLNIFNNYQYIDFIPSGTGYAEGNQRSFRRYIHDFKIFYERDLDNNLTTDYDLFTMNNGTGISLINDFNPIWNKEDDNIVIEGVTWTNVDWDYIYNYEDDKFNITINLETGNVVINVKDDFNLSNNDKNRYFNYGFTPYKAKTTCTLYLSNLGGGEKCTIDGGTGTFSGQSKLSYNFDEEIDTGIITTTSKDVTPITEKDKGFFNDFFNNIFPPASDLTNTESLTRVFVVLTLILVGLVFINFKTYNQNRNLIIAVGLSLMIISLILFTAVGYIPIWILIVMVLMGVVVGVGKFVSTMKTPSE